MGNRNDQDWPATRRLGGGRVVTYCCHDSVGFLPPRPECAEFASCRHKQSVLCPLPAVMTRVCCVRFPLQDPSVGFLLRRAKFGVVRQPGLAATLQPCNGQNVMLMISMSLAMKEVDAVDNAHVVGKLNAVDRKADVATWSMCFDDAVDDAVDE